MKSTPPRQTTTATPHPLSYSVNANPNIMTPAAAQHRRIPSHAGSLESDADWDTRSVKKGCGVSRRQLICGSILLAILLVGGIGTLVAWSIIKRAQEGNTVGVPNNTNLVITPDPNLHKSFYGLDYTPINSQYPECGSTLGDIIEDMKVLSQLTTRIRLYGMDCNQADNTLEAIKQLKINVKIILTVWLDDNPQTYDRQLEKLFATLSNYGADRIIGISVGNEAIFRKQTTIVDLSTRMSAIRSRLAANNYPTIPVYTTDLGDNFNSALIRASDESLANIHPYFAGISVTTAAEWTWNFFTNQIATKTRAAGKIPVISETGWPTDGESQSNAVPSKQNLQIFLDSFICQSNRQQIPYYFFEAFDEPWKVPRFTALEGSWGLLTKDRQPKVTIPDCDVKPPDA